MVFFGPAESFKEVEFCVLLFAKLNCNLLLLVHLEIVGWFWFFSPPENEPVSKLLT